MGVVVAAQQHLAVVRSPFRAYSEDEEEGEIKKRSSCYMKLGGVVVI